MQKLPVLALLAAMASAQQEPELRLVGHAEARRDQIHQCAFDHASQRMLTASLGNDIVYWNLRTLEPLQRLDTPDSYATKLVLHPSEPWAVVGTTVEDEASFCYRVDLVTGEWRKLYDGALMAGVFDRKGERLVTVSRTEEVATVRVFASEKLDEPLVQREIQHLHWPQVTFTPDESAIVVGDHRPQSDSAGHLRITLADGVVTPGEASIGGFAPDDSPIANRGYWNKWAVSPAGTQPFVV